jgi:hypothetical protein
MGSHRREHAKGRQMSVNAPKRYEIQKLLDSISEVDGLQELLDWFDEWDTKHGANLIRKDRGAS